MLGTCDLLSEGDHFCYTRHEPVGVCGQIIPVSIHTAGRVTIPNLTMLVN